ncbi:noncanonical pyrimidine nucleotidase, YjjG family [Shewanella sp. OPT22]|nr:noncanonical pyrimidine nucleotidase, YjjG family [Shewanella sp. OPT22]
MFPYQWVLFDADETLFHFDAHAGLKHLLKQYEVDFTDADYEEYQKINHGLWLQYQAGNITAQQLQVTRFNTWSDRLGVEAGQLNAGFLDAMAFVSQPIKGVLEVLETLSSKTNIGIITNGFTALQKKRLTNTGVDQFIDLLVISEEVGAAKPESKIFEYALERMGNPRPNKVLMVGDNLDTDILGGNQMGFDTCLFNPKRLNSTDITADFELNDFYSFFSLLELS